MSQFHSWSSIESLKNNHSALFSLQIHYIMWQPVSQVDSLYYQEISHDDYSELPCTFNFWFCFALWATDNTPAPFSMTTIQIFDTVIIPPLTWILYADPLKISHRDRFPKLSLSWWLFLNLFCFLTMLFEMWCPELDIWSNSDLLNKLCALRLICPKEHLSFLSCNTLLACV